MTQTEANNVKIHFVETSGTQYGNSGQSTTANPTSIASITANTTIYYDYLSIQSALHSDEMGIKEEKPSS